MSVSLRNLLAKLPSSGSLSKIANSPVGKKAIDILKQLASSAFQSVKQNGLFGDLKLGVNLPNPLKALQKLLAPLGKTFATVGEFMKKIGSLLSGKREIEGQSVTVPSLQERVGPAAQAVGAAASRVGSGAFDGALSAARSTGKGPWNDVLGNRGAMGGGLSNAQKKVLDTIEDPQEKARLTAQFQLQAHMEFLSMLSNIMKMQHQAAMAVINNLR